MQYFFNTSPCNPFETAFYNATQAINPRASGIHEKYLATMLGTAPLVKEAHGVDCLSREGLGADFFADVCADFFADVCADIFAYPFLFIIVLAITLFLFILFLFPGRVNPNPEERGNAALVCLFFFQLAYCMHFFWNVFIYSNQVLF